MAQPFPARAHDFDFAPLGLVGFANPLPLTCFGQVGPRSQEHQDHRVQLGSRIRPDSASRQ
jgi:hypothetical protein